MGKAPQRQQKGFEVTPWMDRAGGLIERHAALWIRLGSIESALLDGALADVRIDRPIYVTGLARSGTTILLETLARHPNVATHRYRDFPFQGGRTNPPAKLLSAEFQFRGIGGHHGGNGGGRTPLRICTRDRRSAKRPIAANRSSGGRHLRVLGLPASGVREGAWSGSARHWA